ncbi:hypothetical protein BV20DRAFT_971236 [Pilatotrama ljubarskyi]|nr:hypothetical protein BV20DRAFT_971236 [Pilatotrama ljubarskyi]
MTNPRLFLHVCQREPTTPVSSDDASMAVDTALSRTDGLDRASPSLPRNRRHISETWRTRPSTRTALESVPSTTTSAEQVYEPPL